MRACLVAIAMVLAGAACKPHDLASPPTPNHPAPAPAVVVDPALLRTLAVLTTRHEPSASELATTARAFASGQLTIDSYIDRLVASNEFAEEVAPLAVLRQYLTLEADGLPVGKALSHVDGPPPLYFLGAKPCATTDAVRVHPWWDLASEVLVCRDAYRPDQWADASVPTLGLPATVCYSAVGAANPRCGCGANLMRCYESDEHQQRVVRSLRGELQKTVAWIVAHDLPAEAIFSGNSTFRDRNAEFQRRMETLQEHRTEDAQPALEDLASWPAQGRWAPREELTPGQHAGLLTAPMLRNSQLDRRQRMAAFYDVMWCAQQLASGATPEAMMKIKGGNLQIDGSGWHELAQRPLCTNCHARMDYGMQFFWGYQNGYLQAYFSPSLQQQGRGELYGESYDDPRGAADLNPHAFGELAVTQPEFRRCMAQDFAGYVLGNHLTQTQLDKIMTVAKPNATSIRGLMRASLHALVDDWVAQHPLAAALPTTPKSAVATDITITITPALAAQLKARCFDCHDADPERVDLSKAQLPRQMVVKMLAEVAFGRMPNTQPLPDAQRREFIDVFVAATWHGNDASAARNYLENRLQAMPTYRPEIIFDLVHRTAGATSPPLRAFEPFIRWDQQQLTPSLATISSVVAIESCHAKRDRPRAEVVRCIEDAIQLDHLAIDPHPRAALPPKH